MHGPNLSTKLVDDTDDAIKAAKADGYALKPIPHRMTKDGQSHDVHTAESRAQAIKDGWKDEGPAHAAAKGDKK